MKNPHFQKKVLTNLQMQSIMSLLNPHLRIFEEVKTVYTNLKALLAAKDITIDTVAKLLGVHRDTVTNKLNGESEFTYGQAEAIQDALFPEYNIRYIFRRVA